MIGAGRYAVGNADGELFAVTRHCRHLLADLADGSIGEDGCLVCPWHGSKYDVETARMVRGPQGVYAKVPGLGIAFKALTSVLPLGRWAADSLAADGLHTDLDQTVGRHLVWALVPAALAVLSSFAPLPRAYLLAFVVIWMVVAATVLAFRHRREKTSIRRRLAQSGVWLLGTGLVTAVVIFVASLFGLTGA